MSNIVTRGFGKHQSLVTRGYYGFLKKLIGGSRKVLRAISFGWGELIELVSTLKNAPRPEENCLKSFDLDSSTTPNVLATSEIDSVLELRSVQTKRRSR